MYHGFWIHSFADGHLGCFQYSAIVNCAAMNIGVHRFFWISVSGFLGYNPSSGIAGLKGSFIFSFLRKLKTRILFLKSIFWCQLHSGFLRTNKYNDYAFQWIEVNFCLLWLINFHANDSLELLWRVFWLIVNVMIVQLVTYEVKAEGNFLFFSSIF